MLVVMSQLFDVDIKELSLSYLSKRVRSEVMRLGAMLV
jgi:hypothetical protein